MAAIAAENQENVTLLSSVTLSESLNITSNKTINLNGKTVKYNNSDVFVVTDGTLTLEGDGEVLASTDNSSSACAVWAKENGNVVIKGGTYKTGDDLTNGATGNWRNDCIYAGGNATITIEGGIFEYTGTNPEGHKFLLNVNNNAKKAGTANIIVKGGKFKNFNPGNNLAEGKNTNFVAEGYKVINSETKVDATGVHLGADAWYEVVKE